LKGSFIQSDNLGSHSPSDVFALIGVVSWNIGIVCINVSAWEIFLGRGAMEGKGEEGEKGCYYFHDGRYREVDPVIARGKSDLFQNRTREESGFTCSKDALTKQ
jgi:hypothetical protein